MIEAIFDCAKQLFGLTFILCTNNAKLYHSDVQLYEVYEYYEESNQKLVAIFIHDNFARPNKESGAWMSKYRSQSRNIDNIGTNVIPIISNNNNFTKGNPTLLSYNDAKTLFHEFG